ncbi:pyruvate dehydrogenase complex dihydrolipoamide acetyltransferase [Curvivirga aplysinae]|uniref:pyruvate dehydrogenase complex dihydrolipoamide acetyltransferase n=1 Tax=Curvivirga aplysinae TaxID=2529852 RepID=UPI0012BC47E8|nr:pyruvate dehydrogenase complex dihydrolipoamide acetyltransferase [Curvivirga aplysinae]MTI08344.1 pyruvate dehydrogenase complex dihydrolipoamide acetyltransferase [Curvivirga aplysinae]
MPIKVLMPALSPTMTEGTLANWLVKVGDEVSAGDVIAEIETDKATMEVEAVDEGTVAKLLVDAGTEGVPVNELIAVLVEEDEDMSAADGVTGGGVSAPAAAPAEDPQPAVAAPSATPAPIASSTSSGDRIFASPLAKRIASQEGLDLSKITGSGPHGRIVKADVETALASGSAKAGAEAPTAAATKPAAPAPMSTDNPFEPEFELVSMNSMRKTIARRLTESKQNVPHFYLSVDCEIDKLLALRKELNDQADGKFKLSVNDIVIKAAAVALRKVPAANASWSDEGLKLYKQADISVAVAIDGGLITPVIRNAGNIGLEKISSEMKELAGKAREGKLMPEEFQGGTFSISNLGMFGIDNFQAVINPPQACILAIGAGKQQPIVKDGELTIGTVMTATLSVDHRAVDGAIGAEYLKVFKSLIETPMGMML